MMNMTLTQKLSAAFMAAALAFSGSADAQVVWGAGSSNPTYDEVGRFAQPFGTANGWTAAPQTAGAFWTLTMNGLSSGAYAGGLDPIGSPSQADGVALFDSDFLDNGGVAGAFGLGTCPAPHTGYLYSPMFDLTGQTGAVLAFQMWLQYRNFQIAFLNVGFTNDNGATWTDLDISQGVATNAMFDAAQIQVNLPASATAPLDLTQCQVRLGFSGEYYFAMIDDIALVAGDAYDIAFSLPSDLYDNKTVAYPSPFARMPVEIAGNFAPYMYGAMVTNKGALGIDSIADMPSVAYDLSMDMAGTWTSLVSGSRLLASIPAGGNVGVSEDITAAVQAAYIANGAGNYRMTYTLSHTNTEGDFSNDTMRLDYILTDTFGFYSACPQAMVGGPAADDYAFPGAGAGNVILQFEWGGLYYFPDTTGYALDSVGYRMYVSGTFDEVAVPQVAVTVNVYEWVDGNSDGQVDFATEFSLRTLAVDNVDVDASMPGTYIYRKVQIVDPNNLNPETFAYDYPYGLWQGTTAEGLYYVSASQANASGLIDDNDQRNGFFPATYAIPFDWNQDLSIEAYSPMRVLEGPAGQTGTENWYSGFTGPHVAPSMELKVTRWPEQLESGVNYTEANSNVVNVFPNPASNMVNVSVNLEQTSTNVRYIVTDAQGRVLNMQTRNNIQNDVFSMDVTSLASGVYFVHVKSDKGNFTKRFVKQ